jgi:CHAT domain-containing protein
MSLCGLALSGANETDEDFVGVISGEEIAARDLSGCELAVLSACETVHGTSRAGHGLASLQGAFHAAGARFVIATRWKIPDERSRELMSTFYAQLWHKKEPKSPRQALDHAKEELRKKKAPVQHWAGFVLTGDPR